MKDSYIFYTDKLGKDYRRVFEQIEIYVLSQNIDDRTREERMNYLLDIFMSAEQAGKPPESVTGKNLEHFCKMFCSDLGFKHSVLFAVDWLKSVAWVMLIEAIINIFCYLSNIPDGEAIDLMHIPGTLNLLGYIIGIMTSGIMMITSNIIIRRIMFKMKRISMNILKIICGAVAILSFLIIFFALDIEQTDIFDYSAFVSGVISAAYLICYYIVRKRDRRPKVKFSELVSDDMAKEVASTMEKKFKRANRKSIKRGKGEISIEKFLEKEEKNWRIDEKMSIYYPLILIVISIASFISTYLNEGFDGISDIFIYILTMLVINYFIIKGYRNINNKVRSANIQWIESKRRELDSDNIYTSNTNNEKQSDSMNPQ